jgi:hypothetical protein
MKIICSFNLLITLLVFAFVVGFVAGFEINVEVPQVSSTMAVVAD